MDWEHPLALLLVLPAAAVLVWASLRSTRPMSPARRRALLTVRALCVLLVILAISGPAIERLSREEAVVFVLDHSQSQGDAGSAAQREAANRLVASLDDGVAVGFVSAGSATIVRGAPGSGTRSLPADDPLLATGTDTDLASAVKLASGLFPPGASRRLVLLGDGLETRGDVEAAAREASVAGVRIDAVPIAGERLPDVRLTALRASRSRLHEGAHLALHADVESSLRGDGRVRLFENGIEVESKPVSLEVGQQLTVTFDRTPHQRDLYRYRAAVEGFAEDAVPANDEAMALVDVRGRPVILYVEGEAGEARYLVDAMEKENIRLVPREASGIPRDLQELAGFDAVVFSDLAATQVSDEQMLLLRDYVETLGGGFLMIGGKNSFGVGGYYRTPIEEILPVKMKAPDKEEKFAVALMLVIDRSGSMSGQKLEIAKSAAAATVQLLSPKDFVGVVAFDSMAHPVVPIQNVSSPEAIAAQIAAINEGGGTNIYPGMTTGREWLNSVQAKAKHMIVLTDGQSEGAGYGELAAQMRAEGMTISTVGIGEGADMNLLQQIAAAGGGQFHASMDPANLPRIFTQDAMTHMGKLIREEAFQPQAVERHPMTQGWPADAAPALLGYVKTHRKATAQVPLVTDQGDPLLAVWRFGAGKVAAFTSDCKSRWGALWIAGWQDGYNQFWAQVLRETARQPQGQLMDLSLVRDGDSVRLDVDVLSDAASYENEAQVQATVYFVAANSLASNLEPIAELTLDQSGPGRYTGTFAPRGPGVYLVRSQAGNRSATAGIVEPVSAESATGQVNLALLEKVAVMTGGAVLDRAAASLPAWEGTGQPSYLELRPLLLVLMLLAFTGDVVIRRWENVLGLFALVRERRDKERSPAFAGAEPRARPAERSNAEELVAGKA